MNNLTDKSSKKNDSVQRAELTRQASKNTVSAPERQPLDWYMKLSHVIHWV